ncbi:penicillin-insensitive murein endopeptidase [Pelagovum pacificum]|uniref:Penicillin-insensitive murein endopeptidase n=1 Tax=Pelagovum pacificum TaxID=2588711 RepID=A0A5C5GIF8_9RHOB|nr:penicillin-insensitive murein endopeptidase [Pelagovum pacificum]QQA42929.1 penicillin-insensitive murein endopeptidase [Pelagovum pacificum]TNY33927.1 penicillin-insensitive murein endopeptidase [Pelagovum pacificum]
MVRTLVLISACLLALASCQRSSGTSTASTQNANPGAPEASAAAADPSDSRVAKDVFGYLSTASVQTSEPIGGYSRGCQAGAVQLPETGPTWQAMRLSRNRNWAQPITVDFVQDLSRFAASLPGWEGLYIGDMSQPRGGPMLSGHASHQIGLDADIWMLPPQRLDLSTDQREQISSISMQRAEGAYTNDRWTAQHMALLRQAASDPRVARIFVFAGAKVAMCNAETGDREWLSKIRPWWGHHYHFHVRLNCPPGAAGCEDQAPPPPGDGCAEAQEWVDNILNPPPPDPNADPAPARGPVTMAQLPGACQDVARSN